MQGRSSYNDQNRARLVQAGEPYFSLLVQLIDNALDSIYIQVYIFDDDQTGTMVAHALKRAAGRGVQVFFLVDGFGINRISSYFIREMLDAGIHFRKFRPIISTKRFYFGRRLHNKVVVVDAVYALVGGCNIADKYNDLPGKRAWLDMAVFIEGRTAVELEAICVGMWNTIFSRTVKTTATPDDVVDQRMRTLRITEPCKLRVRRNDWLKGRVGILHSYYRMFDEAKDEIVLMGSYFLPGHNMRKQMEKATERGVRIRVVLTGVSDVWLSKYAERFLYRWMLRNKIEIYEYTQNVLHSKVALRDGEWMTIGSFNVNNISAHVSVELNVDILNDDFVAGVHRRLENIISNDCIQITQTNHAAYFRWWGIIKERLAYEAVKLLLYLVTFYYKHPHLPKDEAAEYNYY